ncbi:hypothetical protein EG347_21170 [Chryseobacterium sp. G0186]|nr:hypothetical protein EG347_21170 [Chryseobacterium sp. G0186]
MWINGTQYSSGMTKNEILEKCDHIRYQYYDNEIQITISENFWDKKVLFIEFENDVAAYLSVRYIRKIIQCFKL